MVIRPGGDLVILATLKQKEHRNKFQAQVAPLTSYKPTPHPGASVSISAKWELLYHLLKVILVLQTVEHTAEVGYDYCFSPPDDFLPTIEIWTR